MFSFFQTKEIKLAKKICTDHIKPYRNLFFLACFFMALAALSTAALPYLLQPVFDDVFTKGTPRLLIIFCGSVFLTFFVKGIASYGESILMIYIGQKIISDIQKRLFHHLLRLDLSFFHNTTSGEIISRFTNDANMMRAAVSNTIVGFGKDFLTLIFLVGLMFYRDFNLAVIAFFVFPTAVLPIIRIGRRMRKVTDQTQEELGLFTSHLTQTFQGIRVVKAYGAEKFENKRVRDKINKIFKLIYKSAKVRSASHPIMEILGGIAIISVIAYGGLQIMRHSRTMGEFISFIMALLFTYEPLKRLSNLNTNFQEGIAAANRVFSFLELKPKIHDFSSSTISSLSGTLDFKKVSFSYQEGTDCVLKDLTFSINSGETVAFVGSSGAGKSTLINLIPRFYDVSEGSILLDGIDIRTLSLESLRSYIGLVSQETILFDSTVKDNIAYGLPNASIEEIEKAAENARAHSFIMALPDGYETMIGENGIKLSGGQRQRITVARAMLKNPKILLLDEATSALDTTSEKQVQQSLKTLMKGRTTLIVAHRLSTVIDCDKIYVLDKGCIVESGNHTALLEQRGRYFELWQAQNTILQ